MNKKLRLLLLSLLAVFMGGASYAGDTFTVSFNGEDVQSENKYFSFEGKHNFNSKFNGAEYAGISFSSGLKMEGSTKILFTTTATSTVTIVQSTWSSATINFDGTELNVSNAAAGTGCRIYTLNDVAPAAHNITRGGGESGLFYISVEYTGANLDVLATPKISFDSATGEVTIEGDANATSIVYTINGTEPSATNGEGYEGTFTVEDGTTVKAIALGDGESYANSEVATVDVLLDITSVVAPTFNVVYGTVAIACETAATTIEYSTDGENFSAYTKPVTFFENTTVYARATRGELVSEESSVEVEAVPMGDATNTIVMDFNAFDVQRINDFSTLVGKDAAEGYSISMNTDDPKKAWSSGNNAIDGHSSIKLSNGAQNTLYLPEGVSATRITFYSYINSAPGRTSGWREVADLTTNYNDVPMGAWNDAANPDVRTFPLTGEETEINFTNTGEQLCFYIVLDVVENKAGLKAAYDPSEINMIKGEEFEAPTLTITNEADEAVEGLVITYTSSNEEVATVDAEGNIAIVGAGEVTITAKTEATDEYKSATATLKITVTPANQVLKVTENATEVVLSKENTEDGEHGYMTANGKWRDSEKTFGDYTGTFMDMKTGRTITVTEKGAIAFEVFAQNATAGRSYTITVNDGEATTITHNGNGVESSGIINCSSDQITIKLEGTDASIYPLAIKFYTELPVSVNISDAQYATLYYSDKALVVPSGVKAYTIGRIDSKNIVKKGTEYATGEPIPAGEPVVLEGKPGTYSFVIDNESDAQPTEGNLLKGSDEAETTTGGGKYYMLSKVGDTVGFYYGAEDGAAFTNGAHKAYLVVDDAVDAKFFLLDSEATGINTIAKVANDSQIYNLQGVRMNGDKLTKGIYVVNGKKVVIK
jgi:hypothetical protein